MDIKSREQEILDYWKERSISGKIRERNKNGKKFYFLDGPPYVTGELGSHHIWVETIKDIILRYRRYRGQMVHDRAGFDVHGLPIEVKVEKLLNVTSKQDIKERIGVEEFIIACKDYAKEQARSAISTYLRFGSSLDFDTVYMPYENYYIAKGWKIFKAMSDKGLLYKDLAPLAYCPRCETVLSAQGPEVEYEDENDNSIYVRFMVDPKRGKPRLKLPADTYLVIWTTTPWTLPSNIAVAANPEEPYLLVRTDGVHYIIAKARLDSFSSQLGKSMTIMSEFAGSELKGLCYESPIATKVPKQKELGKYHYVIMSKGFVNIGEGTGLLHVAPGHGPEDYKLGKEHGMPIFSPINQHAAYTDDAGEFRGLKVPGEANYGVLSALKDNGSLLFEAQIRHSYPHCWRCHSKLIYRATEQWFINVQRIKKRMIDANKKVVWHPTAASEWFADGIESSPDWCISRQRYWGAPIPIWVCGSCNAMEVIGSPKELVARAGLSSEPVDLHKPYVDAIEFQCKCGESMRRIPDIFDVWYDSGISHTASLSDDEFSKLFPADWITESRDQIRGWFSVLLKTGIALYGKSPFKRVNIGGMIKDELGQEMHRHLGNTVSGNELLGIVSADGYRLWCSSHPRWLELKLKKAELTEADSNIMTLYNIAELVKEFAMLSNSKPEEQRRPPSITSLEKEEVWILSRLNTLITATTANMGEYKIDNAVKDIRSFILEDYSRFYLKFAKQRAELATKGRLRRLSALNSYMLRQTIILASIIMPFSCEHIYRDVYHSTESIFMEKWPKPSTRMSNKELEDDFELLKGVSRSVLYLREERNSKLRWPISEVAIEANSDSAVDSLQRLSNLIAMYANAKSVKIRRGAERGRSIVPIFGELGPEFKGNAQAVAAELKNQDEAKVVGEVEEHGHYTLHTNAGVFDIKPNHFSVVENAGEGSGAWVSYGATKLHIDINTELSGGLREELLAREIIRRAQVMRKEAGLTRHDIVALHVSIDENMRKVLEDNAKMIKGIVRANKISVNGKLPEGAKTSSIDILGAKVIIALTMNQRKD